MVYYLLFTERILHAENMQDESGSISWISFIASTKAVVMELQCLAANGTSLHH